MRIRLLAISLLAFGGIARAEDPVAAADAFLTKQFPADQPGAAVLVLKDGKPIMCKCYGLADVEKKTPITPDSAFDLASVSKQFTAMAIMQLAERGRLKYDDDIRKWIPEMPEFESEKPIRIRDLLNQTSGLIDYLRLFKGGDKEFAKLRNDELPALFKGKKLLFTPGTKWDYSNSNYALLALIVERVSGKSFATWMNDQVFVPLGMNDTRVMDDPNVAIRNRVNGYTKWFWSKKFDVSRKDGPVCGDGNVFTTINDLVKWETGLRENRLVRADTLAQAYTSPGVPDFKSGKPSHYGFGWVVAKAKDDSKIVWHNGGWSGTRTSMSRWIGNGLTVAVLCNNEESDADAAALKVAKFFHTPAQP